MNKILSIAAISALLATAANADLMRIEGAVGVWQTDPTGDISYGSNSFDLSDAAGFESTQNMYAWIYLKHPIPIVPNLRLEYADPSFDGKVTSRSITLANGDERSLWIMLPGRYTFSTKQAEIMEMLSGKLEIKLTNENWKTLNTPETFNVPANSSFELNIKLVTDYCCSYIK